MKKLEVFKRKNPFNNESIIINYVNNDFLESIVIPLNMLNELKEKLNKIEF